MKLSNRNVQIIHLAAVIVLFLGCSKGGSNSNSGLPQVSHGLMPLSVGNYWNYSKVDFDSATGLPKDTVSDGIYIIGEISVNGNLYFQQNQTSVTNINAPSFFVNIDSNTLQKIDSGSQYVFFKRVTADSSLADSWTDTVTSRCKGHNLLVGFTGSYNIDGRACLRNEVQVTDCTGVAFEKWEYYLQPGLGFVRIQLYKLNGSGNYFLQFSEEMTSYHTE